MTVAEFNKLSKNNKVIKTRHGRDLWGDEANILYFDNKEVVYVYVVSDYDGGYLGYKTRKELRKEKSYWRASGSSELAKDLNLMIPDYLDEMMKKYSPENIKLLTEYLTNGQ